MNMANSPFDDEQMKALDGNSDIFVDTLQNQKKIYELTPGEMLSQLLKYGIDAFRKPNNIPENMPAAAGTIETALNDYISTGMDFLENVLYDVFGRKENGNGKIERGEIHTEYDKLVMLAKCNPETMRLLKNSRNGNFSDLHNIYSAIAKENNNPNERNEVLYRNLQKKKNVRYDGIYLNANDNNSKLPCLVYGNAKKVGNFFESRTMRKIINGFIVFAVKRNELNSKKMLEKFIGEDNFEDTLIEYFSFEKNLPGKDLLRGTGLMDFLSTEICDKKKQSKLIYDNLGRLHKVTYNGSPREDKYHIIGEKEHHYSKNGTDFGLSLTISGNNEKLGYLEQHAIAEVMILSLLTAMEEGTVEYRKKPDVKNQTISRTPYLRQKNKIGKAFYGKKENEYIRRELKPYELKLVQDLSEKQMNVFGYTKSR